MITGTFRHISHWVLEEETEMIGATTAAVEHLSAYSIGRQMLISSLLSCGGNIFINTGWTTMSGLAAFAASSAVTVYILAIPLLVRFFADEEHRLGKFSYHLWKAGCLGSTLFLLGLRCHWSTMGAIAASFLVSLLKPRDSYSIYRIPIFLIFLK